MTKYSLKQYNEAKSLYNCVRNYNEVARRLHMPPSTIKKWLKTSTLPMAFSQKFKDNLCKARKVSARMRTKQLPEGAKRLSVELAYIIGVIKGDGCISGGYPSGNRLSRYYVIRLNAIDYDFVKEFKGVLEKWSGMNASLLEVKPGKEHWKKQWAVQLYSNEAGKFLENFDIYELESAGETLKCAFLGGFYDSEGSVYFNGKRAEVSICNTDRCIMDLVENLLYEIGINKMYWYTDRHRKTPCYRISLNSRKEIRIFARKVSFSIKRKTDKLKKIVDAPDMRGKWSRKATRNASGR